ncbi:MAG: hypothetical protein V1809_06705 [Planctomycetota bacterium]
MTRHGLHALSATAILWMTMTPAFSGEADIEKTPVKSTRIDLSSAEILNTFDGKRTALLEKYLCASAQWKVSDDHGYRDITMRQKTGQGWEVPFGSTFEAARDTKVTLNRRGSPSWGPLDYYTISISLNDEPFGRPPTPLGLLAAGVLSMFMKKDELEQFTTDIHTEGIPGSKGVDVRLVELHKKTHPGVFDSYLLLKGKGIKMGILEQSPHPERPYTKMILESVCRDFGKLKDLKPDSPVDAVLPEGSSINRASPNLEIRDGFQKGIYLATGYANPGKKGLIYIRAFDKKSGGRLSGWQTQEITEYAGWSENQNTQYYFHFEFTIYEGDWDHTYPARFELRFKPSDGTPEQKLAETERSIHGWER